MHLVEAKPDQSLPLLGWPPDWTPDLGYLDLLSLSHRLFLCVYFVAAAPDNVAHL